MKRLRAFALTGGLALGGLAVVSAGSWLIIDRGLERVLERQAVLVAEKWAGYLGENLPRIERLIAGEAPDGDQLRFIRQAEELGEVYRWKLFDRQEQLAFDSRYLHVVAAGWRLPAEALRDERRDRLKVAAPWPHAYAAQGDGTTMPRHYAEAFDELMADGGRIGLLEVYVDQTAERARLLEALVWLAVPLAMLSLLAFLAPLSGLLWQTRRRVAADAAREHAARHDPLTGLLNRYAFGEAVEDEIARHPGRSFYVHAFNLEKFREINEVHGHKVGDQVLRRVAWSLKRAAGDKAAVGRLGSDEFVVLDPARTKLSQAEALAMACLNAICEPQQIRGTLFNLSVHCGIARYPDHGAHASALVNAGNLALHTAAAERGCTIQVFEPAMEAERVRRLEVERRLRRAIDEGDFRLVYQPLYKVPGGTLVGCEALLRLDCAKGGTVSPSEFIPVAEETRLIVPLGALVLKRACATAAGWPKALSVAVNISAVQFEKSGPLDVVRDALESAGLEPHRLELEVTESALIMDPDRLALQLDQLKQMGVRIALDDFGTGYSSLSHVWKFPFDTLKIDRSFVSDIGEGDERLRRMLRVIATLGDVLGLDVTAEGIETPEQAEEISRMRVDYVQGLHYGGPMEEDAFARLIERGVPQPTSGRD